MDESAERRPQAAALPPALLERWTRLLPEQALSRLLSGELPRPSLRANPFRTTPAELRAALAAEGIDLQPVAWCPGAFVLATGELRALQATRPYRAGELYVQGLASMTAPLALEVQPGDRVLDLCAAPGGKTLQLLAALEGRGELLANERSRARFFRMQRVFDEQGVAERPELALSRRPGEAFGRLFPGAFERVLVDAPCTAEARVDPAAPGTFADWKLKKVQRLAQEQRRLLVSGLRALAPGGTLVYATCTFGAEENEAVVARALRSRRKAGAEVELEELPSELTGLANACEGLQQWGGATYGEELGRTLRLWPDGTMNGFYLARFRNGRSGA